MYTGTTASSAPFGTALGRLQLRGARHRTFSAVSSLASSRLTLLVGRAPCATERMGRPQRNLQQEIGIRVPQPGDMLLPERVKARPNTVSPRRRNDAEQTAPCAPRTVPEGATHRQHAAPLASACISVRSPGGAIERRVSATAIFLFLARRTRRWPPTALKQSHDARVSVWVDFCCVSRQGMSSRRVVQRQATSARQRAGMSSSYSAKTGSVLWRRQHRR